MEGQHFMGVTTKRYLFVADEKGDPGLAPGASSKLVFGGYVVAETELPKVEKVWRQFKVDTCGTPDVELKSEHFFASRSKHNPLLSRNQKRRRTMAMEGFELIYNIPSVAPLAYCVFKNRAPRALIVEGGSGKPKIDANNIWVVPLGAFAVFLANKRAVGQVWWDNVSGEQERVMKNSEWQTLRCAPSIKQELQAIDEEILFLDSKENEAIQVADFLCGVLWQAMNGDEVFLVRFIDKYSARIRRDGLGIIIIE